jgi:2-haloacid dehalogenase
MLKSQGLRLFAFSNGTRQAVEKLLAHAKIRELFLGVISVDDIKTFKPSPAAYAYFLRSAEAHNGASWLISSNLFDVTGAISAGMQSAWIQRSSDAIFDPWEIQPTVKAHSLLELVDQLKQ